MLCLTAPAFAAQSVPLPGGQVGAVYRSCGPFHDTIADCIDNLASQAQAEEDDFYCPPGETADCFVVDPHSVDVFGTPCVKGCAGTLVCVCEGSLASSNEKSSIDQEK